MTLLKNIAFEEMAGKSSHSFKEKGNKYYHGERVAKLAVKLRQIVIPDDDSHDDILTAAAWFHDIRNGIENHAQEGAEATRKTLSGHCTDEELDKICEIITVHDDRFSPRELFSDCIKLQQDADLLDHFGTFDIWSIVLYSIHINQTINETRDYMIGDERQKENEYYRNQLNFEVSRKIYDEKIEFLTDFTKRFDVELNGGIWNEDKILKNLI